MILLSELDSAGFPATATGVATPMPEVWSGVSHGCGLPNDPVVAATRVSHGHLHALVRGVLRR